MTWRMQMVHFKDAVAVNLPGHPQGAGYSTIEDYFSFIERLIEDGAINAPILIGHSMGGAIAMTYALRNPNLKGLVLVGTGARLRVHPDILARIRTNYEQATKLIASWSVSPACDPVIIDRMAAEMLKVKSRVTYGDFAACDNFDRMNDLERISCKTLIVCGADDQLTPVKYSQYLNEKILNSRLVVIPGAGHSVMLEKHRAFNEVLDTFLGSLSASAPAA